jgi:LysM domain
MKRLVTTLCFGLFLFLASRAQSYLLIIQGETGKFYLDHTVAPKENWYSVGRLYNISPRQIAPLNGLTIDKPLTIGQQLKIPLTAVNFSQSGKKSSGEALVPLYHVIKEKEWMYHISSTYNKVPIATLEKWNHITGDQAKAGMQLIVGYLKVKSAESTLASEASDKSLATTSTASSLKKEDPKPLSSDQAEVKQGTPPATKAESKPAPAVNTTATMAANSPSNNPSQVNSYAANHQTGGFFINDFTDNNKMVTGQAATFKSTSGWQDGKYYALMNNVAVGTIIKITSPGSNKTVFAKVLGQLPDMKESAGLSVRISNAAAAELGTGDAKFPVEVRY